VDGDTESNTEDYPLNGEDSDIESSEETEEIPTEESIETPTEDEILSEEETEEIATNQSLVPTTEKFTERVKSELLLPIKNDCVKPPFADRPVRILDYQEPITVLPKVSTDKYYREKKLHKNLQYDRGLEFYEWQDILDDYQDGKTIKDLALEYNLSTSKIYNKFKKLLGDEFIDKTDKIAKDERHDFNLKITTDEINKILDDPAIPLWRIVGENGMYQGIYNDKDLLTTEQLALKYGTTERSILRIIENGCYITPIKIPEDKINEIYEFYLRNKYKHSTHSYRGKKYSYDKLTVQQVAEKFRINIQTLKRIIYSQENNRKAIKQQNIE